jgi:hypothetical protein
MLCSLKFRTNFFFFLSNLFRQTGALTPDLHRGGDNAGIMLCFDRKDDKRSLRLQIVSRLHKTYKANFSMRIPLSHGILQCAFSISIHSFYSFTQMPNFIMFVFGWTHRAAGHETLNTPVPKEPTVFWIACPLVEVENRTFAWISCWRVMFDLKFRGFDDANSLTGIYYVELVLACKNGVNF